MVSVVGQQPAAQGIGIVTMNDEAVDRELKALIADILGIDPAQAAAFEAVSGLFGHLPELDSMAVAGLLTEMEDRLGILIDDDDVDGEMLETYGGLLAFARSKLAEAA
jgi:acyl carrier protein